MAVVFRAQDERLGRVVALKILAPVLADDEAFRRRFIRESRAAAAVDDPHIIPVFEAGEAGGVLFIAMRYVAGGDVRSLLRRSGQLPALRAASIVSPVASALDAAHDAGLVHRDVKPANMLIDTRAGRPDHVYLSDFGLSKGALSSVGLTGSGLFLGTPDYVSPEQIAGREVDGRADQYALACAAFEMLSGQPPFLRDHGMAVIYAHASEAPPPLTSRRPGLPAALDAVLARALAKDPADRYGSCQEFGEAMRSALGIPPYDVGTAGGDEERSATVAVPQAAAEIRSEDETRDAPADSDGGTLTRAPRGAGDPGGREENAGPAASPAEIPAWRISVGEADRATQVPAAPGHLPAPAPRARRRSPSLVIGAAATLAVGGVTAVVVALHGSSAAGAHHRPGHRVNAVVPMTPVPSGSFNAVIAGPAHSAWAIGGVSGDGGSGQLLIERWNGATWSPVPTPSISGATLIGAAAGPDGTAWAVGASCQSACGVPFKGDQTLVLHWDGTAWSRTPSPSPRGGAELFAVAAGQDGKAWAIGCSPCANTAGLLLIHWDGTSWSRFRGPANASFNAVAAGQGDTAWTVGPPILRWNGTTWTQVPSPASWTLNSVSVEPDGTAWAVGYDCTACGTTRARQRTVVLRWDGTSWSRVPSPSPGPVAVLWSVSAGADGNAWAVGYYCTRLGCEYGYGGFLGHNLILRWNGSAWIRVPSPNPGLKDGLISVASDGRTAWAAGQTCISQCNTSSAQDQTLILRWNGTSWVPG
jgi:serine/threonine-protein kinase